ncbi:hypothetical protein GDO81_005253 [Engystomops pustulosus]|uniref:Uncharacterized protein n=1 Tax=Engystomops pustulosus TaxID=76066 RepID=A0AAV7CN13_ENGPU|nr:hypothetical protein GDO81_005253 [Engystomops pustulosus]
MQSYQSGRYVTYPVCLLHRNVKVHTFSGLYKFSLKMRKCLIWNKKNAGKMSWEQKLKVTYQTIFLRSFYIAKPVLNSILLKC